MKTSPFTAENANEAVRLVQENLGPEAVIVSVRKLPASGFRGCGNQPGSIEVTAAVPETEPRNRHRCRRARMCMCRMATRSAKRNRRHARCTPLAKHRLAGIAGIDCRNSPTGWS